MKDVQIALIGNPNTGKSTLFNVLTGSTQKVGNWPGVTVDKKTGSFHYDSGEFQITDLPGTYNLSQSTHQISLDETIAINFLLSEPIDCILNIVDATNLERNLFLTTQLRELEIPIIIVLNMTDLLDKAGTVIDLEKLSDAFKCPVVKISANKKNGLNELKKTIYMTLDKKVMSSPITYPPVMMEAIAEIKKSLDQGHGKRARFLAIHLLEQYAAPHPTPLPQVGEGVKSEIIETWQQRIEKELHDEADIILVDHRYQFIHEVKQKCIEKNRQTKKTLTSYLDKIVLNRFLGMPIFLAVMYCLFLFAINIGGAFQDFFDIASNTIFVDGLSNLLMACHTPFWLTAVLTAGIGKGINTTITFIPIIGCMFLFLSFLEGCGYMTRAAFVVDRLMQAMGLPGKSFVPLIVGFGCNVPAIMAARTLENRRDRILTILMTPFMSCGARLAIYAVFTAAFFPKGGQNVVFSLYLIGIIMAILTGFILRKTLLTGQASPLIMEMPAYHLPTFKNLLFQTWHRLNKFLMKAGKVIVPVCILIGTLNAITIHGEINQGNLQDPSVLAAIGQTITPIFSPMGIAQNNWPATVGILTGTLAKEVVVGSLNTLYTQAAHLQLQAPPAFHFWASLKEAFQSIPDNLKGLAGSLGNPVLASAPTQSLSQSVYGEMYVLFGGQAAAYAYLLFILLYFPCVSATAAVLRELNRGWTIFAVLWTTGLAYGMATLFYQIATFRKHPGSSSSFIIGILFIFFAVIYGMKLFAARVDQGVSKEIEGVVS